MGHDNSSKQHNMSWSKFQRQMSIFQRVGHNMMLYLTQKNWKFFEFFVRPRVVVCKHLKTFRLGVSESTGFFKNELGNVADLLP